MSTKKIIFVFILLCLSVNAEGDLKLDSESDSFFCPKFMDNSISFLQGNDYELGERDRNIIALEHFSSWEWGDVFSFLDYSILDEDRDKAYRELQPRLSFSYLTGKDLSVGIIKDFYLATEYNANDEGFKAYLAGLGMKLNVPGFKSLNLNLYYRNEIGYKGDTYQITANWNIPIHLSRFKFRITGFIDVAGPEGDKSSNVLFVPQIVLDVGDLFNHPNHLFMGFEYSNWSDKFGVQDKRENVYQFLIKYHF